MSIFAYQFMEIRKIYEAHRGKYRASYDPNALTDAYNAVMEENMSAQRAAAKYGVPCSTLKDRIRGHVGLDVVKSGPQPMFSLEQESLLTQHINTMAELGFGYTRQETINLASDYAIHLGLRSKGDPLSLRWLYNFLGRWPELGVRKPRSLEVARARSATRPIIDKYFKELEKILTTYSFLDRPNAIFNVDEKGLSTEHKPPKIVSGTAFKLQAVTSGRSQTVTVIGAGNAIGHQVPPFFIFPGKRMTDSLMQGSSTGAAGTMSDSGWSNTEIFSKYIREHLTKYMPQHDASSPVLVLYDGHRSHISISLIEWAKENHIILFVLPPHCSHLLQPLDVSCYGPFELSYNSACHTYLRESGGNVITKHDVCGIACKVYTATLTPSNIQAAFKKCGIYPFNPSVISDSLVAPSMSFSRPNTNEEQSPQEKSSTDHHPSSDDLCSTSAVTGAEFLEIKGGEILKNVQVAKVRRTLSKVVAGKAITDDTVVDAIKEHVHSQATKKRKEPTPGPSKTSKNSSKIIKSSAPSKNTTFKSTAKKGTRPPQITYLVSSESDTDSEIAEEEKCCVCHQFTPKEVKECTSIIFTKWGQCDACNSRVHLIYCSPVKVIRRGDEFYCPECTLKRAES